MGFGGGRILEGGPKWILKADPRPMGDCPRKHMYKSTPGWIWALVSKGQAWICLGLPGPAHKHPYGERIWRWICIYSVPCILCKQAYPILWIRIYLRQTGFNHISDLGKIMRTKVVVSQSVHTVITVNETFTCSLVPEPIPSDHMIFSDFNHRKAMILS